MKFLHFTFQSSKNPNFTTKLTLNEAYLHTPDKFKYKIPQQNTECDKFMTEEWWKGMEKTHFTPNDKNNTFIFQHSHTVSVVFSKRCPSRHHVITAGGLDPALWHSRSYLRPADSGWCAPRRRTFSGETVMEIGYFFIFFYFWSNDEPLNDKAYNMLRTTFNHKM